jgi:hypothetical protein
VFYCKECQEIVKHKDLIWDSENNSFMCGECMTYVEYIGKKEVALLKEVSNV